MVTKFINKITFSRLSNAYHVSFMSNVKTAIEKVGAENLGIAADLLERFTNAITAEQDVVNKARASVLTRQLAEYDRLRDAYFRRIIYKLRIAENDVLDETITDELIATIDTHILKQYPLSIANDANQKQTAQMRGLIADLETYLSTNIEKFDLLNDIAMLKDANDKYEQTYMQRFTERTGLTPTSECRQTSEAVYLQITFTLAANANTISDQPLVQAKAQTCGQVIDEVNLLIQDFKVKGYKSGEQNGLDGELDAEDAEV